jgi:hypothetical protein
MVSRDHFRSFAASSVSCHEVVRRLVSASHFSSPEHHILNCSHLFCSHFDRTKNSVVTLQIMKVGVSLSPGGLLLPYHVGVLDSLQYKGCIQPGTPIAGASAGAIAAACHSSRVPSTHVLESAIDISEQCKMIGGARGNLLPLVEEKLDQFLTEERFQSFLDRPGPTSISYREIFPKNQPVLQQDFHDRHDLIKAVCYSSMFPFFATNWPATIDYRAGEFPRLLVDGWFTGPRDRSGCPCFSMAGIDVDRTITVSPFPRSMVGLVASDGEDCICPEVEGDSRSQFERLFRICTQATSRDELTKVYEEGWHDAERWFHTDKKRSRKKQSIAEAVLAESTVLWSRTKSLIQFQ